MSEEPEVTPDIASPEIASDEHPLSLLLFSWMRGRDFDRFILACVAALCAVLAVLDLLVPRQAINALDALPVFFGVFGLVAFGLAVLSGWPLGRLLRRPETYYDRGGASDSSASARVSTPLVPTKVGTQGGSQEERGP
jgi:hypothetical protein